MSPDAVAARRDEDALWSTTDAVLRKVGAAAPGPPRHPARKAAAHGVRTGQADGAVPAAGPEPGAGGGTVVPPPRRAAGRWPVDLADPAPHLEQAVGRALASLPPGRGPQAGATGTADTANMANMTNPADTASRSSMVRGWDAEQAAVLTESADRMHRIWPPMLAELREGVRQIALLHGPSIDGFTDFTTHGAVFVNASRLTTGRNGLPGWVRLADALVHEGTHTRCNAAALGTPFLVPGPGPAPTMLTPLRPDPRPLTGLFQQTVVLARQVVLYRLLHEETPAADLPQRAMTARRVQLLGRARQGAATLSRYSASLTPAGEAVRAEVDELLAREGPPTGAHTGPPWGRG
ncbi:aKG-HExxH-type peptide beta-hydroxylase [Streptomyces sp. NPDC048638]|uniref:aKG-HExxH-type peptide beta-hydroxylase n=1 Tax=Streptomyces sp. NPDC048638 TaxID=3365580 RepID=UPI00371CD9C3